MYEHTALTVWATEGPWGAVYARKETKLQTNGCRENKIECTPVYVVIRIMCHIVRFFLNCIIPDRHQGDNIHVVSDTHTFNQLLII